MQIDGQRCRVVTIYVRDSLIRVVYEDRLTWLRVTGCGSAPPRKISSGEQAMAPRPTHSCARRWRTAAAREAQWPMVRRTRGAAEDLPWAESASRGRPAGRRGSRGPAAQSTARAAHPSRLTGRIRSSWRRSRASLPPDHGAQSRPRRRGMPLRVAEEIRRDSGMRHRVVRRTVGPSMCRPLGAVRVARMPGPDSCLRLIAGGIDECWPWLGTVRADGYARFLLNGREEQAHRAAHILFVGPIPDGYEVDHVRANGCTRTDCVNWVRHLEAVTPYENNMRSDTRRPVRASPDPTAIRATSSHPRTRASRAKGGVSAASASASSRRSTGTTTANWSAHETRARHPRHSGDR